ncbi:MAG: hypothetical protein ACD_76C00102G0007 [uncultured bacterium]|nr:MAG: hypothetical protein ACD_76C00102G0007 [uncultured bacterium]HBD05614.1 hypothetical protein [Candidatus Uhrbacteria bacterium]
MSRSNCWEFKRCGREPYGAKAQTLGVCPAATERRLDGVHGGRNSGRACWVVAGTFCRGEVQGTYADKEHRCSQCDFFLRVREEHGREMHDPIALRRILDE